MTKRWTPHPFRQFIVKVHGRCDLACDYCYVFTKADDRWRTRPPFMSRSTMRQTAERIAEHAGVHRLPAVDIVLHGGEPLLAGPTDLAYCLDTVRSLVGRVAEVGIQLQTNAVRLDDAMLRLFARHRVRIGVSLDGDRSAHDRHRVRANGAGTHDLVVAALHRLRAPAYRHLFGGLLCTIDLRNDPVRTYEALLAFAPPAVDFLLPQGNWSAPPPGRTPDPRTPYADWLIPLFERWYRAPSKETNVRLFDDIIALLLGGSTGTENLGGAPSVSVVVETDGSIETSDALSSAYRGAAATGRSVLRDSFDDVLGLPGVIAFQRGAAGLAEACRACRLRRVCGGGLPAHRYRADNGFDNPSVYCPDLYRLIDHVRTTVERDVAALRRAIS